MVAVLVGTGRDGLAIGLGPQAAVSATVNAVSRTMGRRAIATGAPDPLGMTNTYGSTLMARLVPLTPTIAAGVSRRTESGESFAIRPET